MAGAAVIMQPRTAAAAQRGFTLIEILVVVVIIAVLVSVVTMTVRSDPDAAVEEEAQRLAALLRFARQEALLQGRELALEFTRDGYTFLTLEGQEWLPLSDRIYRRRTLPQDVDMELYIEGEQFDLATLARAAGDDEEEDAVPPRVYILSSGEMTPFEVVLQRDGSDVSFQVRGDPVGQPQVTRR